MKLHSVLEVLRAIAGHRERRELMATLLQTLRASIRADYYLAAVKRGRGSNEAEAFFDPPLTGVSTRVSDYSLVGDLLRGRAALFYEHDIGNHPVQRALWERYGVRVSLRIPLMVEHEAVGTIALWSRDRHAFDGLDMDVMTELGMVVAVTIDSCLAYEHLARLRDEADDDNSYLREALADELQISEGIIGGGPAFATVKRQIEVAAPTETTVLLTGESGTGKDVVARAIHAASPRRDRPLVTVNCAAIPNNLAETELFGHEEGAFTGAAKTRVGRFEQANGGTLFLDEVGELPMAVQAKLLRVIQERELERVGGGDAIKIDVRIIAATNRNLQEMINEGRFREDLFFRLAVFPIHLPPLRSRLEDLPELVEHFVKLAAERFRVPVRRVTPDVVRRLADHDWPGNVRELQHAIERAMIVSPSDALAIDAVVPRRIAPPVSSGAGSDTLRAEYLAALESAEWVIEGDDGAAARLGVHPNTLRHRLKRMGIARPTAR
ncbi:MAG TPA: sigma 54-interacting transcriptional regulator [Kofleriaceae bacterium]|nr:sigma 54-interacting transcriptional regulator [Kofleriaceae bacterium]